MNSKKKIMYLVRHCEAQGQHPDAGLTAKGREQANRLAQFFADKEVSHIISSPYVRAIESIGPTLEQSKLPLKVDSRLAERVLGSGNLPDWLEQLERSFDDMELKLAGGESGSEAAERGVAALSAAQHQSIIVTHGNLLTLLLNYWDSSYGFDEWRNLSNPDVFKIEQNGQSTIIKRLWC